ncbi:MAG: hypothetical protein R6X02_02765 [Enhygromyxa sp.]
MSSNAQHRPLLLAGLLALAAACGDDGPGDDAPAPACLTIDYEGCALLYPPTWEQVWQQTISTSCSGGGSACHAGEVGLSFQDPDSAYAGLAHELVIGDPNCSPLMLRLESDDPEFRMPPGNTPLAAGARCSIATWIANGAAQD